MQKNIAIIEPYSYLSPDIQNGYKKDINIYNIYFNKLGIQCKRYYNDRSRIFGADKRQEVFKLRDIVRGKTLIGWKILFSPLSHFQNMWRFLNNENHIYYAADSLTKPAVQAFVKSPLMLPRVIRAIYVERAIRNCNIIVASQEEAAWFSSIGHDIDKIHYIPPTPDANHCSILESQNDLMSYDPRGEPSRSAYDPDGAGVRLAIEILRCLGEHNSTINVLITGQNSRYIKSVINCSNIHIKCLNTMDDADEYISRSKVVCVTDVGGSGLCNRSVQVRFQGTPLVSTLDGIRGTPFMLDEGVKIFNNAKAGAFIILGHVKKPQKRMSHEAIKLQKISEYAIVNLAQRCLGL